jgi:hypothetical protein
LTTTEALIEWLKVDRALRRICGFSRWKRMPAPSTFSRAFDEFAQAKLAQRVHEALVQAAPGHGRSLGHVPLIDHNPRGGEKIEFDPAQKQRYKERSQAERANARLKDEFGGKQVWVRGHTKVMSHLMFGLLGLTADPLLRLLT